MRVLILLFLFVAVTPFPGFAQDTSWIAQKPFKGVELYSWKDAKSGTWRFSLLPGTNRNKTIVEIMNPNQVIVDVGSLKKRLATLAKGETIFWNNSYSEFSYPATDTMNAIIKFAAEQNIKIVIVK